MRKILPAVLLLFFLSVSAVFASDECSLPVLMYHSIDSTGGEYSVTEEKFERDIDSLISAGYTPVLFEDVIGFVHRGEELPEKPVVITFDDGYKNNYEKAFKIAEEKDVKFEMFGVVGFMEYSSLAVNWEQVREMEKSGDVDVGSHTFNLHSWIKDGRVGVGRIEGENFRDWEYTLRKDIMNVQKYTMENTNENPVVFAYPFGNFSTEADRIFRESGYLVTVTSEIGVNVIKKGDLESLYLMMRIPMDKKEETAAEAIEKYKDVHTSERITKCKNLMWTQINASRVDALSVIYKNDAEAERTDISVLKKFTDTKYLAENTKKLLAAGVRDGIIKGFSETYLAPKNYITRGEFALMLARKCGFKQDKVTHKFNDTDDWNELAISWCCEKGYILGYGDGSFGTDDFLTKQQLEEIYSRISQ